MFHNSSSRIVINVAILAAGLCAAGYSISLFWPRVAPSTNTDETVQTITAHELKELLVQKGDKIALVDIRERDEFRKEHIPSAINIPFDELEVRAEDELSKSSHIVLYYFKCGDENKISAISSSSLKNLGFPNVTLLDGGIDKWREFTNDLQETRE